jgi:hypothetical protein
VLLVAAAIISWPWRVLELPGTVVHLSPISVALLTLTVFGGAWAMKQRLPAGLLTWPAAGLGALLLLSVDVSARTLAPEAIVPLGYFIIFVFVVFISLALAKYRVSYAVGFACLFLMSQATQVTVFELDTANEAPWRAALTGVSVVRALVETGLLLWLTYRLVVKEGPSKTLTALAMVGLVVAHGPLIAWEQSIGAGSFWGRYGAGIALWTLSSGLQLAMVTVTARLRQAWSREPALGPQAAAPPQIGLSSQATQPQKRQRTARGRRRR